MNKQQIVQEKKGLLWKHYFQYKALPDINTFALRWKTLIYYFSSVTLAVKLISLKPIFWFNSNESLRNLKFYFIFKHWNSLRSVYIILYRMYTFRKGHKTICEIDECSCGLCWFRFRKWKQEEAFIQTNMQIVQTEGRICRD